MIISKIHVKKLFGDTDVEIPINVKERVTIIHAPNGFGKTTTFRLVHSIFKRDFDYLQKVPFEKITIEFSDTGDSGKTNKLIVSKNIDSQIETTIVGADKKPIDIDILGISADVKIYKDIYSQIDELRKTRNKYSHGKDKKMVKELEDIDNQIVTLSNQLGAFHKEMWKMDNFKKSMNWLNGQKVMLIESQRLIVQHESPEEYAFRKSLGGEELLSITNAVDDYSAELKNFIKEAKLKSAAISQNKDKTFPNRLINQFNRRDRKAEEEFRNVIMSNMEKLHDNRFKYSRYNLLEADPDPDTPLSGFSFSKGNRELIMVLDLFLQDALEKLEAFEEIYTKLDLFFTITNEKFSRKKLEMDSSNEMKVVLDGRPNVNTIKLSQLSSGEQNQIVINYNLLFKPVKDSLILIDEPEISQDIAWQTKIIEDFQRMAELGDFYVLVATHSPQIVGEKWDMLLELGM